LCTKQSQEVEEKDVLEVTESTLYVGRGGIKLEYALREFKIPVSGAVCLDIGASTGGFTQCLLQHGASLVYAVDVGTAQLDSTLLADKRVVSIEQTDIRDIKVLPKKVDVVVIDVSFISLSHIVPLLSRFVHEGSHVCALVKPQFELGKEHIGKNGIVKDESVYPLLLPKVQRLFEVHGYTKCQIIDSPIRGGEGNKEFFIHCIAPKV
jgi:23S rRNA (cytidine1920-2'-O)/16S rRNA (cytidine1409-2'-O)-methyltransferase